MQPFLHFSSSSADDPIIEFFTEAAKAHGAADVTWLSRSAELGAAGFCEVSESVALEDWRIAGADIGCDVNLLARAPHKRALMLCDMDSTIITGESLDDLSAMAGIGEAVASITARAMAGEIDFRQALAERLAMLKGEPAALLDKLVEETKAFDGAAELVATMRKFDATCLLVSGGFTFLTSDIANRFGFSDHFANQLALAGDKIAGYAEEPIMDSATKLQILNDYSTKLGISADGVMSMGDGANDIPMLEAAGLGIAWQGKPLVRQKIDLQLNHSTLCGPLFLQGISESEIVSKI